MSRSSFRMRSALVASALVIGACGGGGQASYGPEKVAIPTTDGSAAPKPQAPARELPPPSGTAKESPFPAVSRARLANGVGVAVVTSKSLPIVQIRVLVRAGSGFGPSPAVAGLTGDMLKDGGTRTMTSAELLSRVETLGSDLSVRTDFDATVLSMAVTKDQVGEALRLLSQVVREPRFDGEELKKLKSRTADEAEDAARSSGSFTATRLVFREIFPAGHPYATYGNIPAEIAKVDGAQIREFHKRFYVPKATTLVLAGDVDEATAKTLAETHFGSWNASGEPPKVEFGGAKKPEKQRVFVAHRPKSVQSDVFVAMLAPPRQDQNWPSIRVASQILGGGVASRLFADVREQRSLAYRTSAQILELAHGPQPLVLYAGTESSKTAKAIDGLLENAARMVSAPPDETETATARRYLSDIFAIRMETIGSIADMLVTQDTFALPDGYWDAYRKQVRATTAADADATSKALYGQSAFIVVAGDADTIAPELTRFGEVTVIDPEKEFKTVRTLPQAASK